MIIRDRSYPHPVLAPFRDDVSPNIFNFSLIESHDADNYYLDVSFEYENATLAEIVAAGKAFHSVHVETAAKIARAARHAGARRFVHVSGIGANAVSSSPYIRSRGEGEAAVQIQFPGAAIVRPHSHERPILIRYLNAGADGLMVPMVDTVDQARAIVEAVRYACPADYEKRLIVAMIETSKAIENIDHLLAVEGVDVFFIGPGDLSQNMGYPRLRRLDGHGRKP